MNARQQSPVAPFRRIGSLPAAWPVKFPRSADPLASIRSSAPGYVRSGQSQHVGERRSTRGPGMHHPTSDHRKQRIVAGGGARRQFRRSDIKLRIRINQRKLFRSFRSDPIVRSPTVARTTRQPSSSSASQGRHLDASSCQSASGMSSGNATSVCSASCSSSASRTSGQCLFPHLRDRVLVEPADFLQHSLGQYAAHLHRARATFFQRSIVEIGVRIRVQNLVRKLRRHRRVHGKAANRSVANSGQHRRAAHRCPSPRSERPS